MTAKSDLAHDAAMLRATGPILPRDTVAGRALVIVVAIMTFLAALTVGTVMLVRAAVGDWRSDMAREVTVQFRPTDPRNADAEIRKALAALNGAPGIAGMRALSLDESGRLLEPWLGGGLDLSSLPMPRLIVLRLAEGAEPDLVGLRRTISERLPGASLDDHREWSARLSAMSDGIVLAGSGLLALVLAATVLSISFATRGAVATNRTVVEVLHLVGARDRYIAGAFQRHFLAVGVQGAMLGGLAAASLFLSAGLLPEMLARAPGGHATALLLGQFSLDVPGYAGIACVAVLVVATTALASRLTVYRTLRSFD